MKYFPHRFFDLLGRNVYPRKSKLLTTLSSLLQDHPPLCLALVLRLLQELCLSCSLNIKTTGSHVPHKSLCQVHAFCMPDAVWTVNRYPPDLSRANVHLPVLTSSMCFSTLHQRFTYVHLLNTHLTGSCPTFSLTLTTIALNYSRLRWFEASSCKATPRDLPSSSVQLRTGAAYAAACVRGTQTSAHFSLKFSSFGVSTQYFILSGRISA